VVRAGLGGPSPWRWNALQNDWGVPSAVGEAGDPCPPEADTEYEVKQAEPRVSVGCRASIPRSSGKHRRGPDPPKTFWKPPS